MGKYFWLFALLLGIAVLCWWLLRFIPGRSKAEEVWPRLYGLVVLTGLAMVGLYFVAPQQVQVIFYKIAQAFVAGLVGYWFDRWLFPYARPDSYLRRFWQHGSDEPIGKADYEVVDGYFLVFALAQLRRALIVIAVVLGVTLGL